jgi:hypothetical protein
MAVRLIFSFDSEDFETPAADDAEKWWAETMTKHGIQACICVVGELARALRERGRRDVVEAMARHEIAFHSDMHSAHPTWAEYLDTSDWAGGVARVTREESRGIADVRELFGQHPSAWCKPGASWGPQVAHAMVQMDVPVFCDSPFETAPGRPLWYDNCLFLNYHTSFDRYFGVSPQERLGRMKEDLAALCDAHEGGCLVMYTHPCRLFTTKFTDTFRYGQNPPREQWQPAPLRPAAEIQALQQDFDDFLAWVVKQPNLELTTYRACFAELKQPAAPWLPADVLPQLGAAAPALDYQWIDHTCLSPAEQFSVVTRAVAALGERQRLPEAIPVRRLLGPTEPPPLSVPSDPRPWPEFAAAARWADALCSETGATPARIPLGGGVIGPNAFLQAAVRALMDWQTTRRLPDRVEIRPVSEDPAIVGREDFAHLRFKDAWSIFPPDFEGRNVLEMIRLQAWTAKPAGGRAPVP